jgi:chromosome partitioning protein
LGLERDRKSHGGMRNTIAMMNTKGGVGKSTLVLGIAETLSASFGKNVLVIDADAQASVSLMLLTVGNLNELQIGGLTVVDLLVANVLKDQPVDWTRFAVSGVSDVEEARTVYLIPSDMQLTLFEREVAKEKLLTRMRLAVGALLTSVRDVFDVVLIDCPPGLSVLTESLLREADFYISPTKPDHICVYALEVFNHFKGLNPEMGFAENLGVLVNMQDMRSKTDTEHQQRLVQNRDNRCFSQVVPRTSALQHAAQFKPGERSYDTKYPGDSGVALRNLCLELLDRLDEANSAAAGRRAAQRSAAPSQR